MMQACQVLVLLACASVGFSQCSDGQCAERLVAEPLEDDADVGSLVQLRAPYTQPKEPDLPLLVFGTAVTSFHNASIWVYEKAMRVLGYEVKVIYQYEHEKMYPMFTGHRGILGGCKTEGCSELCAENGLGDKSPCLDFVVDANIPLNHAKYLEAYQDVFDVVGTSYGDFYISLFTPKYSKFRTIEEAAKSKKVQKTIIGFKTGYENDCATYYCPVCGTGDLPYITQPPLGPTFKYKSYSCPDFEKVMERKLRKKKQFIALMFTPSAWLAKFDQMRALDLQNYTYLITPNSGKALLRKEARHKFSPKAQAVLQAVFIGMKDVQDIDGWAHGYNNDPPGPLCDYQSFNAACSEEAAEKWVRRNQNIGNVKGKWPSYFW